MHDKRLAPEIIKWKQFYNINMDVTNSVCNCVQIHSHAYGFVVMMW